MIAVVASLEEGKLSMRGWRYQNLLYLVKKISKNNIDCVGSEDQDGRRSKLKLPRVDHKSQTIT